MTFVTINEENYESFLVRLGFTSKEGEINKYSKEYKKSYEIVISLDKTNFKKSKIYYGEKIQIGRKTTCNFSQQENFVILECVNRLLNKGFKPESIILEKDWKLGHKEKGCLDIQILDNSNKSFLMIECKTFEKEYDSEKQKMYESGGQLFSYFIQDKETKYLCLYTSVFLNNDIQYDNAIIKITPEIVNSNNQQEAYENWTPQIFEKRGIFEEDVIPYIIKFSGLKKSDLKPITKKDGGNIFNRFAEILRKNVVSDKTNAYNKIFNLFLCKIVDEYERSDEQKLKFQWEEEENNVSVLLRLNELYKRGMENYLNIHISSVDIDEFTKKLKYVKNDSDKEEIKNLFIKQKLYTSNDFAFKEVFDEETFNSNCIVVKEVVKLLEEYKIKYETKQQFLGDFFEKLLNTGIKQEVGQFFTPVPIAQFICKSLPTQSIINEKNQREEIHVLPYVIDYASGAGHFLTEIMEEINGIITNDLSENFFKNQRAKKEFNNYKNDFDWAKEYIYGIEKDYRLAKTTKVATYLNGDGDAQIICGDGLDSFFKSKDYTGLLKLSTNQKENKSFDMVIANPPYSVSGFKSTLIYGKDSFDLFNKVSIKSKEIECFFIERTKQLLRNGGIAGIILPSSILSNTGIYTLVREIFLTDFEIIAIVEFGSKTFMATGTNTITLFLRKVENKKEDILYYINKAIKEKKDLTINNIEKPISKYLKNYYEIDFKTYLGFFENPDAGNKELGEIEIYKEYLKEFSKNKKNKKLTEFVRAKEIEKLMYFIFTYNKKVVISTYPKSSKLEKEFLGYEFSNRRGYEGINIINLGGSLYNPTNPHDKSKVSYYILKNYLGEDITEIDKQATTVKVVNLSDCIDYKTTNFEKIINLRAPQMSINSKYDLSKLKDITTFYPKSNRPANQGKDTGKYPFFTSSNTVKYVNHADYTEECIIVGDGGNSSVHIANNFSVSDHNFVFKSNSQEVLNKYIFYFLKNNFDLLTSGLKGSGLQNIPKSYLKNLKMPIPPKKVQEDIIKNMQLIEQKQEQTLTNLIKSKSEITNTFEKLTNDLIKLGDKVSFKNGLNYNKSSEGDIVDIVGVKDFQDNYSPEIKQLDKAQIEGDLQEDYRLKPSDILVVRSNGSFNLVGRFLYIQKVPSEKTSFSGFTIRIRPNNDEEVDAKFLCHYLRTPKVREKLTKNSNGSNIKSLNQTQLSNIKVPLPPISKQKEIITNIDKIEKKIIKYKSDLSDLENEKQEFFKKKIN